MIVGYEMIGQDNGEYMFDKDDPDLSVCKKCGYVINFDYINPNFKINKNRYDFSYTYDGRCIVSLKFKEFCIRNNYSGLDFLKLPADSNFFYLKVRNIVSINLVKQNLVKDKFCEQCDSYEGVVTKRPLYIENAHRLLNDCIYSTDILLGGGNSKASSIIIGIETYNKIIREKFKGITFLKVED